MVRNKVLGSRVCVKNTVLGSRVCAINQYLLIKNPIAPLPNSKAWVENAVLHSTGNYVDNVFKIGQEVDQSGIQ